MEHTKYYLNSANYMQTCQTNNLNREEDNKKKMTMIYSKQWHKTKYVQHSRKLISFADISSICLMTASIQAFIEYFNLGLSSGATASQIVDIVSHSTLQRWKLFIIIRKVSLENA